MWKSQVAGEEKPPEQLRRWIRPSVVALLLTSAVFITITYLFSADTGEEFYFQFQNPPIVAGSASSLSPSPPASPTNISHVVFAVAASARTWHRRKSYSDLWWEPSLMRGHVWLDEEPSLSPWPDTSPPYKISADASRFGNRASASRIARIAAEAYNLGLDDVRWFVMGDDDTVFFPVNLVAVLGRYDHREMYYIGAPSESVEQDLMHSYGMAFGGGGFALSAPAAAALAPAIDGCLDRYSRFWGSDQRVKYCLSEIGVPLTREAGFHQVDLRGNLYGMLAAHPIAPLVSLHHLDYVKPIFPTVPNRLDSLKSLVRASRFDPPRTLQQTFCYHSRPSYNWSVSVSWGYTVQIYPYVLPPKDLEVPLRTFETWKSYKAGPFAFNTRELETACKWPEIFFLDRVKPLNKDGWTGTVSEYPMYKAGSGQKCDGAGFVVASKISSVRVTATKMDRNVWQKAPRRQCCDTQQRRASGKMDVRVRECYPGEITSPP